MIFFLLRDFEVFITYARVRFLPVEASHKTNLLRWHVCRDGGCLREYFHALLLNDAIGISLVDGPIFLGRPLSITDYGSTIPLPSAFYPQKIFV